MTRLLRASAYLFLGTFLLGPAGCAIFGANLPPGSAGGDFTTKPTHLPRLSPKMRLRRDALDAASQERIGRHFTLLHELIGSSAALREQVGRSIRSIEVSFLDDRRVSPQDRELVLEGAQWFIELDLLLYNLWTSYREYLPYSSEPDPYAPVRGASLLASETRAKGGLLALVAEVVRLDNARVVMDMLQGQWAITQFLNAGDSARGIEPESFDRLIGAYFDPDRRALIKSQLVAVQGARKKLDALAAKDGQVATLLALLEESVVARELIDESGLSRQVRFSWAVLSRSGVALLTPALNIYIAAILTDEGVDRSSLRRLAAVPGAADGLLDALEPLDVLVLRDVARTRAGRGYTHAVVYLGDYSRLKDGPARDHIAFVVNKARMRRGKVFLDVSARGVELVDLDDLLEAQDVAVFRYGAMPAARREEQRHALDALVTRRFVTPPQLGQREHSAALLFHVFGAGLRARETPGRQSPPLSIIIQDALQAPEVTVVFSTLDGNAQPASDREKAVNTILDREGPLDVVAKVGAADAEPREAE